MKSSRTYPWTSPADILAQLMKHWNRGQFLVMEKDQEYSQRIVLKGPGQKELPQAYEQVLQWIQELRSRELPSADTLAQKDRNSPSAGQGQTTAVRCYRIEWQDIQHRTLGRNQIPRAVVFPQLDLVLRYLGKQKDYENYQQLKTMVLGAFPELLDWCQAKPFLVLEYQKAWPRILEILGWCLSNPHSGVYLRQVTLPGVDSKFLETHKTLLRELLDRILPESAINPQWTRGQDFERRFGFRSKPTMVRFRSLDSQLHFSGFSDLSVPADQWCLAPPGGQIPQGVFMTENEINYLAFPACPGHIMVFGKGYGFWSLAQAHWLRDCPLYYWGDIDTHGFAILDQLRHVFPHARSLLMDRSTFLELKDFWGKEDSPVNRTLTRLTPEEQSLYLELVNETHGHALRLEQERIPYSKVHDACNSVMAVTRK